MTPAVATMATRYEIRILSRYFIGGVSTRVGVAMTLRNVVASVSTDD